MPLAINSNLPSLNSQRQLVKSGMELDTAMERLSSGKRINSAADDAAGLAISNRLTSQIRGLDRAVSNANDGISLIQTAEGALDESTNILQRMRELSIQSANGIYADGDRATLDAELQQLVSELDRISSTTSFNGQKLLDGSLGQVNLQIGAEANQTVSFSIDAMSANSLGLGSTSSDVAGARMAQIVAFGDGDILINGQALSSFSTTAAVPASAAVFSGIGTNFLDTYVGGVTGFTANFSVNVDGAQSTVKTILHNIDYLNNNGIAAAIENLINTDGTIVGAGKSVTVNYNGTGFDITSSSNGVGSSIVFDNPGTSNITVRYGLDDGIASGSDASPTATDLQKIIDDVNTNIDGATARGFNVVEGSSGTGVTTGGTAVLTLGDTDGGASIAYTVDTSKATNMEELAAAINGKADSTIKATVSGGGNLVLTNDTGGAITAAGLNGAAGIVDATYQGSLGLSSDDGSPISITLGANGTDAQLKALGFREIAGSGQVLSEGLSATEQSTALATGDLKINGVGVASVTSTQGLGGKVDAINALTDETGVTASITATGSYTNNTDNSVELVNTAGGITVTTGNAGNITVNGVDIAVVAGDNDKDFAADINASTSSHGVTAYVDSDDNLHLFSASPITLTNTTGAIGDFALTGVASGTPEVTTAISAGSISINNSQVALTDLSDLEQIVKDINNAQGDTGVRAAVDSNGALKLSSSSVITLEVGDTKGLQSANALGITFDDAADDGTLANDTITIESRINLKSAGDQPISLELTANGITATGLSDLNTDLSGSVTGSALSSISIGTVAGATDSITSIDQALETINGTRSELGAVSNRLDFTVSNLMNISENSAAARSRIVDADFAAETASLSRAQVLQQAASAMLAQANAAPQQVLSLLR